MEVGVQGPKCFGEFPVGFWICRKDFDLVVGNLQVVVLLGDISLSKDLIIVWMSMTSLTNIGGGGGLLCACWFGGGPAISMASFEDSSIANLLWVLNCVVCC